MPEKTSQTTLSLPIDKVRAILPPNLHDCYWEPCLLIFLAIPVLVPYVESYFNFEQEYIDISWFNQAVFPCLSDSQQFMVSLAFHLFNSGKPLPPGGLANLRDLDRYNFELALSAIRLSIGGNL